MTPFAEESARCRVAQRDWAKRSIRERLVFIREFRHRLVDDADRLTAAIFADVNRPQDEVIGTDFLPTAAAAKFLESHAERILKPRRVRGRPLWLLGTRDVVHRRPHGIVGLIGTWNYPLFLNAVPILQALAAGNGVLWKPSELTPRFAEAFHEMLIQSGFPTDLVTCLPATREAGPQLAEADVDFLHFTGSDAVGRKLAARLGERLVPSTLELSGCDALIVLPGADVRLAARSAMYGATLNGGQTCMATRRVFVHRSVMSGFLEVLKPLIESANAAPLVTEGQVQQAERLLAEARAQGCQILRGRETGGPSEVSPTAILEAPPDLALFREASFAPLFGVVGFDATDELVRLHNDCPLALAGAIFTADEEEGRRLAGRLRLGAVVINDVIVPTAHPATPFGGHGSSGWGVTQGAEGLLAMTVPQVVTVRKGTFRPHVDAFLANDPAGTDVTRGTLAMTHGRTLGIRWKGFKQLVRGLRRKA